VIIGDDAQGISELKLYLQKKFQTKIFGIVTIFFGHWDSKIEERYFSLNEHVLDILSEASMLGCKPVDSLMDTDQTAIRSGRVFR